MDGLSNAASGIAVVSLALQLADGCIKLYDFWSTVRDAPEDIAVIVKDLEWLSSLLKDVANGQYQAPSVSFGLEYCKSKLEALLNIVRDFERSFSSNNRRVRVWTAFKAARKKEKLKDFRTSLHETKTTLTLALMLRQAPQVPGTQEVRDMNISKDLESLTAQESKRPSVERSISEPELPSYSESRALTFDVIDSKELKVLDCEVTAETHQFASGMSVPSIQASMENALQLAAEKFFENGTFAKVMNNTLQKVTSVQSTYHSRCNSPPTSLDQTPTIATRSNSMGKIEKVNHTSRGSRVASKTTYSRICHSTSATGTLFGTVWVRTTTLKISTRSRSAGDNLDIITSFIFYPAQWLTKIGMNRGMEANLSSSRSGFKFNFNTVYAVPDDSLIFKFCQTGNLKAVRLLISEGNASVRDTSSKGWTPLHFAAEAADAELCEFLISAGADKTALAYEGPTEDSLSPVTLFVDTAQSIAADQKIRMLRLFTDLLDFSEPDSDGWTVIGSLVRSYNKENVSPSLNAATWLLRSLASESLATFGPKTIWHGLQHSVRSLLVIEQENMVFQNLLILGALGKKCVKTLHSASIAHWLTLQIVCQELLPLLLRAGAHFRIDGFDFDDAEESEAMFEQKLPRIFSIWNQTFPVAMENVGELLAKELAKILEHETWTKEGLRELILSSGKVGQMQHDVTCCSACSDDYSSLGIGLVDPCWMTFAECTRIKHKFDCSCESFLQGTNITIEKALAVKNDESDNAPQRSRGNFVELDCENKQPPDYHSDGDGDSVDQKMTSRESEWIQACEDYLQMKTKEKHDDPFEQAAYMLYRTQGRTWLGSYEQGELLCATCFLRREGYINEDGLGLETIIPSMPASFHSGRTYRE